MTMKIVSFQTLMLPTGKHTHQGWAQESSGTWRRGGLGFRPVLKALAKGFASGLVSLVKRGRTKWAVVRLVLLGCGSGMPSAGIPGFTSASWQERL